MEIYRMKKSLFALAATTAIAGAAQAQSSVTVYGILDAGLSGGSYTTVAGPVTTTLVNQTQKTTANSFAASNEQTSRLGFKGNEDLGGGASAFFTIEMGIAPMYGNLSGSSYKNFTGDVQNTSNGTGSAIDNRQTFVGLKKSGIGQVALGRQYTPVFNSGAATNPGQYNNIVGDVVYLGNSSVDTAGGMYYNTAFTNRADSALTFQSDKFAGFQVNALYALQNSNSTANGVGVGGNVSTGGNTNWGGWGLSADYSWNKLFVTAAYQSFKTVYTNAVLGTAETVNIGGLTPTQGASIAATTTPLWQPTNRTDKQFLLGATYDFGILKAYAQYVNRNVLENDIAGIGTNGASANVVNGTVAKRSAQQIGVRSFVTPTIEAWGSVGNGQYQGANTGGAITVTSGVQATVYPQNTNKFNAWQLGSNYWLSKRTNLYAIYGQTTTSGVYGMSAGLTGTQATTPGAGSSASQYALGLRHTF
jgi:predicted porin